jgi:hypothetical protein
MPRIARVTICVARILLPRRFGMMQCRPSKEKPVEASGCHAPGAGMARWCACSPGAATTGTECYPAIAVANAKLRAKSFTLDGERDLGAATGA